MLKHFELEKKMLYQQVYHVLMYHLMEAYATQIKQEMENELPLIKGKEKLFYSHRHLEVKVRYGTLSIFKIDLERLARYL